MHAHNISCICTHIVLYIRLNKYDLLVPHTYCLDLANNICLNLSNQYFCFNLVQFNSIKTFLLFGSWSLFLTIIFVKSYLGGILITLFAF